MARMRVKKKLVGDWKGWDEPIIAWNREARKDRVKESKKEDLWGVYWSEVKKWDRQIRLWGG